MGEQQVHAPRLRGHVVLHHPALGVVLLGLAQQPLEIADIAIDRGAEIPVAIVAAADLVERRLAVEAVEVASEHATLSGTEALPDLCRGTVVDGARDLIEAKALIAALLGLRSTRRVGVRPLRRITRRIGIGQEVANRPSRAPALRLAILGRTLLIAALRLAAGWPARGA